MYSHWIYGTLLGLSLGLAWQTWTKEPDSSSQNGVVVLQGEEAQLEELMWDSTTAHIEIYRKKDALGSYLWVKYKDLKKDESREFKAGAAGEKLLKDLSPLMAIRKLDAPSTEKLSEIGLSQPETSLIVTRKGTKRELAIGNEAYGTRDLYVQEKNSGVVFLVDDEKFRALKYASSRLPDRKLWAMEKPELAIQAKLKKDDGQEQIFKQKNAVDRAKSFWFKAGEAEEKDAQVNTWLGKILKLNGAKHTDLSQAKIIPQFTLELSEENGSKEELSIVLCDDEWYAKSSYTRGYLKLSKRSIEELVQDLPDLFSSEASEE
ncbi:MAG: hypothetical protein CMK59_00760 [Proteobacteria bacterium]|nr:hypothetical protein [Pseudomonadota bacterium]